MTTSLWSTGVSGPARLGANRTPVEVYQNASGGGSMFVDEYSGKEELPVALCTSGTGLRKDSFEKKKK
jgi:hypothetical protein